MQVGLSQENDDAIKEHQRCSKTRGFIRGVLDGNITVDSSYEPTAWAEQPTRSRDVCESHFEYRTNSHQERCTFIFLLWLGVQLL